MAYGDREPLESAEAIERIAKILAAKGKESDAALRDAVAAVVRAYTAPEGDGKAFLAAVSKMLFADIRRDADISRWNGAIDVLRHTGTPRETLLHQAQAMIGETEKQTIFMKQTVEARAEAELMAAERELITSFNLENLRDIMAKYFFRLGLDGAALCLFDDPENPLESARLVAVVRGGKKLDYPQQSFSPRMLVPPSVRFTAQAESPLIVEPVYYRENRLGYIVFEQTDAPGVVYESLAAEISAAIEGTLLIERITATEKQLVERTNAIERLIRPMIESIGSISQVSSDHRREVEKLDSLNRRNENALKGMRARTESLAAVLEKTGTLVAAIDDISELINVVAINASIEAAHVGKAGAGFAVIAGEVRKLAAATNKNAEAIDSFLGGINADISGISASNDEVSESFSLFEKNVQGTVLLLEEISSRMETLNKDSTEILKIMDR